MIFKNTVRTSLTIPFLIILWYYADDLNMLWYGFYMSSIRNIDILERNHLRTCLNEIFNWVIKLYSCFFIFYFYKIYLFSPIVNIWLVFLQLSWSHRNVKASERSVAIEGYVESKISMPTFINSNITNGFQHPKDTRNLSSGNNF